MKGVLHGSFLGTITNPDGDTFRDHSTFTETYDLVNGTTTVSGSSYHYIVKGQGTGVRRGRPQDHDRRDR